MPAARRVWRASGGAARNAIDCALWDLEAKLSGRDVAELIGEAPPPPVATALTISIDAPEAMAEAASVLRHVPLLKVKVDALDPAAQIRRCGRRRPRRR